jgi:hypothetical protein
MVVVPAVYLPVVYDMLRVHGDRFDLFGVALEDDR